MKIHAIARQLGMGRATVRRYVKAGSFPETAKRRKRSSILDPYLPYLERRWAEGCHNGVQLYREIRQQGYSGSRPLVSRWAAQVRRREPKLAEGDVVLAKPKSKVKRRCSSRWLVIALEQWTG